MKTSIVLMSLLFSANVFADFDETQIQAPIKESNDEILYGSSCRTRDHGYWDVCFSVNPQNVYTMRSFKFTNYGENKIVPMSGFGIGRDYEFNFEGLARSDMSLLLWDAPDEVENHAHLKMMYFFPRTVMPAIRYADSTLIVTLPTQEEVVYDAKTREVLSGVLSEGPVKQNANGQALAPNVQYTGSGVVLEASALADWPVGFNAGASKFVTIKKKGQKNCIAPMKDLFYTDANKGGNVFFNKKYITDAAFDTYLKKTCGFTIN